MVVKREGLRRAEFRFCLITSTSEILKGLKGMFAIIRPVIEYLQCHMFLTKHIRPYDFFLPYRNASPTLQDRDPR